MPKLYIIDASGYIYRSYFAIRNMTNSKGLSTNALFGFIRSVQKLIKDFSPDHLVSVFDGPHNAKSREAIYEHYKAHRASMPPDLLYQIEWARRWCDIAGLPSLSVPEMEADDVMGSIAVWGKDHGFTSYLATSDKDLCQLVQDNIFILNTFKENLIMGPLQIEEAFGVRPDQIVDFLSLTGDSSDNIPGVPGFGPKTAADLLKTYGTLDNLLENAEKLSGKKKDLLIQEKESALLSRRLVTIHADAPFPRDPHFFELKAPCIDDLKEFYTEMNFTTLLKEIKEPPKVERAVSYHLVDSEEEFQKLLTLLNNAPEICFNTETTATTPLRAEPVGISFSVAEAEAWYLPLGQDSGRILKELKFLFENPSKKFFAHNAKFDFHILLNLGIEIKNISFDTMLASYILNAHERRHNLDHLVFIHFDKVKSTIEDLLGKGKKQISIKELAPEQIAPISCEECDYTFRLKNLFTAKLNERGLDKLYFDVELPLIKVLAKMERRGIYIDVLFLNRYSQNMEGHLKRLSEEIYTLAGEEFNLNSPKQLSEILFTKLGIKPPRKTATGLSTDADVLEKLRWNHPIAEKLLEYRSLEKLRSTYIDKLPGEVNPATQRIHCTFNQTVAATGRLSCQEPNLQNIPVRTEEGRMIREAFRPEKKGWSYVAADYSQIELRLMAHISEDPILLEAFLHDQDIHTHTASQIFGVPLLQVTSDLRFKAKAVNFGIMYGQGDFGLSENLGIPKKEAAEIIEKYFQRYSKVKLFIEHAKEEARKSGRATTLTGRERLIPEIMSKNFQIRLAAERLAVNTPLQGTQADLIKMAMLKIDQELERQKTRGFMILQIHDELIFEVPDEEIPLFKEIVPSYMSGIMALKVPLKVDLHVGKNWKEC